MKIIWLDRLISTLDTQSWGIGKWSHPAGSHPFPAGPKGGYLRSILCFGPRAKLRDSTITLWNSAVGKWFIVS